ncbi:hypothetical protein BHE97_04405 [Aeromicrobium sp. PE09-221]|uniref:ABC transporter substrate-binding protein n=1 Tax=Aeromicrobium sp. PE09-221 TaxID=1898043 RepID=UPI000B3EB6F7|nr:extracellular solute-binding protein [Aeromicrobium sp. PE09-221]OUZ11586.1 hypothetical protein BHE97_04405 [Aeromicrobium sp. PE09-221]
MRSLQRRLTATIAAAPVAVVLAACGGSGDDDTTTLSLSHWGGIWEEGVTAIEPGLSEATGITIRGAADGQNGLTKIQQLPTAYDAALLTADKAAVGLQDGTLQPIDTSRIENLDAIPDAVLDGLMVDGELAAVPISYGAQGILYREDLLGKKLTSWADLWDPDLENNLAIGALPSVAGVFVLQAGGEAFGEGPEDLEAGWEAMERLRPNIQYQYTLSSDPLSKLADGSLLATVTFADLGVDLADSGVTTLIPEEGTNWSVQPVGIPAEAENVDAAYDFINYMLSDEAQSAWVEATHVAPASQVAELPTEISDQLLETDDVAARLWPIDWLQIGTEIQDWTVRWQELFS